jgi:hypothetical protein
MDLHDFITPVSLSMINEDEGYVDGQIGRHISTTMMKILI